MYKWTNKQLEEIKYKHLELGLPPGKICKDYEASSWTIRELLKDLGVYKNGNKKSLTDRQEKEICNLYFNSDVLVKDILKKYNISGPTFQKTIKNQGLELKKVGHSRTYSINKDFFKKIDSSEKAYWLGFLYADGYINEDRGKIRLGLASRDREHLNKFKKSLNTDTPIKKSTKIDGEKKYFTSFIEIGSVEMVEDLVRLGCHQAKSLLLTKPDINKYKLDFIRGYLDGDGSVHLARVDKSTGHKYYKINIVGTKDVLNWIKEFFNLKHLKLEDKGTHYILHINGNLQVRNILNSLYLNSELYLDRKYNMFVEINNYVNSYKGV